MRSAAGWPARSTTPSPRCLTGIVTQLEAADQARSSPAEHDRHLEHAKHLARESLAEARRSVEASMPGVLESGTLPQALSGVASEWAQRNGIPVDVTVTGDAIALHPEIEVALLRTAQEALANVAKHAAAARVWLTLSYMGDVVVLDVRDDGIGFTVAERDARDGSGFGLTGMRQRVARVAGSVAIESEPGGGTAVSARVPADRGLAAGRSGMTVVRVLIVDDHPVVRDGLRGMLAGDPALEVVGEASDGAEALAVVGTLRPDVILMDLRMPGMGGVATIRALAEREAPPRVLVLTTYDSDTDVGAGDRRRGHRLPPEGHAS